MSKLLPPASTNNDPSIAIVANSSELVFVRLSSGEHSTGIYLYDEGCWDVQGFGKNVKIAEWWPKPHRGSGTLLPDGHALSGTPEWAIIVDVATRGHRRIDLPNSKRQVGLSLQEHHALRHFCFENKVDRIAALEQAKESFERSKLPESLRSLATRYKEESDRPYVIIVPLERRCYSTEVVESASEKACIKKASETLGLSYSRVLSLARE